jgi:hypothetical protein
MKNIIFTIFIFGLAILPSWAKQGKACENEKKIYNNAKNDVNQFSLAVCYNLSGNVGKSLDLLEEIIERNDKNTSSNNLKRVNLELGAAYFQNRNYKKAKKTLTEVLTYKDLPPVARRNVNNILNKIKNIKTFGGSVALGTSENDNINSGTYSNTVEILGNEVETRDLGSSTPIKAKALNYSASLYKKFFLNKNFDINLITSYNDIHYADNSNYDIRVFSPKIITTFNAGNYESSISANMSKIYLGHKDYNNNYNATYSHQYNFSNYFIPKYSFSLTKMNYLQESNAAYEGNSKQHNLDLRFNIIVKNNFYGYITPYYNRSDNNLELEVHSYFSNKYGALYVQKMPFQALLSLNYYHQNKKYDASSAIFLAKKNSETKYFSSSISRKLFNNVNASLSYSIEKQDSDVKLLKYNKEQFGINISYGF